MRVVITGGQFRGKTGRASIFGWQGFSKSESFRFIYFDDGSEGSVREDLMREI